MLAKVSVDAQAQTATFAFDKPLAPGKYVLSTDYTGKIGTQANGFFRAGLPHRNGKQRALYAVRKLRCAPLHSVLRMNPTSKATFDLTVNAPTGQMAVGNARQRRQRPG